MNGRRKCQPDQPSDQHGFTLVELMVVLAIVATLAAIAYPVYARHVIKARRAEAQMALLELMQKQEQYFTRHNAYLAFSARSTAPAARHFRWWSGTRAASSGYELRAQECDGQPVERCIVLKALPGTEQVDRNFRDAECGTLVLFSSGRRAADGPAKICWP